MRAAGTIGMLAVLLLSGCLVPQTPADDAPPGTASPIDWNAIGASIFDADHDHHDRAIHQERSIGLKLLNQATFSDDGKALGEYIEADHERGLIAVAVVTGAGSTMRIVLLDEAALPDAKIVGAFTEPSSYGDVKLDATQPLVYVPFGGSSGRAFTIWDIADVAKPRRVGEAAGSGCHMLHTLAIQGTSYVFCAGLGGSLVYRIEKLPDASLRGVHVATATPQSDPEARRYSTYYSTLTPIGPALLTTPHDQTAQLDPITKQPLLVTAHELQGIRVFDINNPLAPREISLWRGQGMSQPMERVHTVGLAAIGGKRIGFAATETFTKVEPSLYIVDFTDFAAPRFLARWTPPGIPHDGGLTLAYSMHNLQVVGTRLYATNFHAGLWIMDVSDPAAPVIEALRTPVKDAESSFINEFWDVIVVNGYAICTDMGAGIEILHVDGDPAGEPSWDGFT
jgi:hypothetical protein